MRSARDGKLLGVHLNLTTTGALVGRTEQCGRLDALVDGVRSGTGGAVLIEGEAGTGKSALVDWTVARARELGVTCLLGHCWERSASVPFEPVTAAIGAYLRRLEPERRDRLTAGLPSLGLLFDGIAEPGGAAGAPGTARLLDAVASLLARIAADGGVLLAIDDLHWSDDGSLDVIRFLSQDLPDVAVGLLLALRPTDADARLDVRNMLAPWRRKPWYRSVTARRLDRDEVEEVVTAALGGVLPGRLLDLVWARSGGTPLVVHQLLADLVERRALQRTDTGWELVDDDPPIPRELADLVRERVRRIDPPNAVVLDALAVADGPADEALLAAVVGEDPATIAVRLTALEAERLVTPVTDEGGGWRTEHPLVAEVVARDLGPAARQRLHRAFLAGEPDAPAARRAYHLLRGGRPDSVPDAIELLLAAGRQALERGATSAAVEPLRAALGLIDPSSHEYRRTEVELATALVRQHQEVPALEHLWSAWEGGVASGDDAGLVAMLAPFDDALFRNGRGGVPIERIEVLRRRLADSGRWDLLADVLYIEFQQAGRNGDLTRMATALASVDAMPESAKVGRAGLIMRILDAYRRLNAEFRGRLSDWIAEFRALADDCSDEPDLQYRALLLAFDIGMFAGDVDEIGGTSERLRRVEQRLGQLGNWRTPMLRALQRIATGSLDEPMIGSMGVAEIPRRVVLAAVMRALVVRYTEGPDTALARFEKEVRGYRATTPAQFDAGSELNAAVGAFLISVGSPHEREHAEHVERRLGSDLMMVSGPGTPFGCELVAARCIVGRHIADRVLDQLDAAGEGRWLPSAWAAFVRARFASGAAAAPHLLQSASMLEGLGRPLEAAERVIDAAEADRAAVPDELLERSIGVCLDAGATWLVGRAEALPGPATVRPIVAPGELTRREQEVAELAVAGLSNREIAAELYVSIRTVTSHLDHIYTKLAISSREQLRQCLEPSSHSTR